MANGNIAGLGRFRPTLSPYDQAYLRRIRESGAQAASAIQEAGEEISGVFTKEAQARAAVKDVDFKNATGFKDAYSIEASALKDKIGGRGDDAYDFSKESDIIRFSQDVERFNSKISAAEDLFSKGMDNLKALGQEHDYMLKVGGDVNQALTQKVGDAEVYNTKSLPGNFEDVLLEAELITQGRVTKEIGEGGVQRVVLRDEGGEVVRTFGSTEEMMQRFLELGKPDLQPVPVLTGTKKVETEKWDKFPTEIQAESRFVNHVLNNPQEAIRRAAEKAGGIETEYAPTYTNPAAEALIDKHPRSSEGFDKMSDDQYDYLQELLQAWRDKQELMKKSETTGSQKSGAADLLAISPSFREMSMFSDAPLDAQGQALGAEAMGGSATISLGKDLSIRIETKDAETGDVQPMRLVKVRSIGRDQFGAFGFGYYKDEDGNERTVRVPLPADPFGVAPGGLIDEIKREFKMSPQQYKQLLGNLFTARDSRFGAGE